MSARLLICDRDQDIILSAAEYLRWHGHEVDLEEDSSRVEDRLQKIPYDMLLCDFWCAPLPMLKLCQQIRQSSSERIRNIPFAALVLDSPSQENMISFRKHSIRPLVKYREPSQWVEKIQLLLERVSL